MRNENNHNLGIMYRREHAPESLPLFARKAEEAGFDEIWVVEDCFYASGIASATAALAVTNRISVGLGIMPAVARNPVFTAMEIATLARLYPGRFLPGIGHGMAGWMRQIGAFPKSQLAALEEVAFTVREILAGKRIDFRGKQVHLDQVELVHPPDVIPPISLGVRGPKSLALSGKIADGTILAEFAAPAYVSWAKTQIAGGIEDGSVADHRMTVFVWACAGASTEDAREGLRPLVASAIVSGKVDVQLAPMGIMSQVRELRSIEDFETLAAAIPDPWIDQLAVVGTPDDWRASIDRFVDAGADAVVLVPLPGKSLDEIDLFADHFLR
jgi:alkanesulfonate monooxygenase SsuD/methylene tetrahydromethanopterin reductase-like flavin-dependent oxidoreductase (luciferase family)